MMAWHRLTFQKLLITALAGSALIMQGSAFSQSTTPPDMPNPRVGMCSARLGSKLFLIGGSPSQLQNMQGVQSLQSLQGSSIVDAFDFSSMAWDEKVAPLNTPRAFATAVSLDDSIYVMGGVDNHGRILNSVEVYDESKNEWHYAPSMLKEREGAAAVVYGDTILVFGGGSRTGVLLTLVEAYSPSKPIWIAFDSTIFGRAFHYAVKVGRSIYLFGGIGGLGPLGTSLGPFGIIERYTPATGSDEMRLSWGHPRTYFGVVDRNDSVYAISGYGSGENLQDYFYQDIDLLNFGVFGDEGEHETRAMLTRTQVRAGFVADQDAKGTIYLFGGLSPGYKSGRVPTPTVDTISSVVTGLTSVVDQPDANPKTFNLSQNYPNPFNPTTVIGYQLAVNSFVTLKIYDMLGREVKTLVDRRENPGDYSVSFDGTNLPSGPYIYRLETETGSIYRKMVLIK